MDKPESSSVENIRKAAGSLKELRPHYRNVLDYYEQLLIAQEMVKDALALSPIEDSHGLPKEEAEKSMVLANISAFSFDKEVTRDLMEKMCDLRRTAGSSSATLTNKFKAIINADGFEFETFIRDFLSRNGDAMNHLASVYGLDREFLFHVTYHSLQPSIQSWANGAAAFLPENFSWNKGVCPVCGERPALATIDDQGKRFLHCSFCWQKWHVNRGLCPVCDNHDPEFLQTSTARKRLNIGLNFAKSAKPISSVLTPAIQSACSIHLWNTWQPFTWIWRFKKKAIHHPLMCHFRPIKPLSAQPLNLVPTS